MIDNELLTKLKNAYSQTYVGMASLRTIENKPFVNNLNEFIAVPKSNSYFRLEDCFNERDIIVKMLHWLSRDCGKAQIPIPAKYFNQKGFNEFLGTQFDDDDFNLIYDKLGNGVNPKLTSDFIDCEFDLDILKEKLNE